MNKPKILISVYGGVVTVEGATEDMKIYILDWDDIISQGEVGDKEKIFEQVVSEWRQPSDNIEEDFDSYVRNVIQRG